ncbi:hypothetical protein [Anabaena sp. 4-3]|uniref:hypothetical protein n=1 Tax=Anabaena sp. 4-3 TaxID=1811979 RepID=UPI0012E7D4BA|nr:hypothetical protein [Anabaena sp. 4-3]
MTEQHYRMTLSDAIASGGALPIAQYKAGLTPEKKQFIYSTVLGFGVIATFEGMEV